MPPLFLIPAAITAFSCLCPIGHTARKTLLISLITKAFINLSQAGDALIECPASPSFYGPQAPIGACKYTSFLLSSNMFR